MRRVRLPKGMLRWLTPLAIGLSLLAAVLLVRALTWNSRQVDPGPVPAMVQCAWEETDLDAAVDRLAGAIPMPTISHDDPRRVVPEAFHSLRDHLTNSFPLVHEHLTRDVVGMSGLLYTWRGTDPDAAPILLSAHLDVVPISPSDLQKWTYAPFSGEIAEEDGTTYVWGRGTLDDKSAVLAMLEAVEALLSVGFEPARTVLLAFGHDEEVGGKDGAARIAALLAERDVKPLFLLDEGGAITEGIVPGMDGQAVGLIGIAEKGYASVVLMARSTGGHSSMPPKHTAIGKVAAAVRALEEHPMPPRLNGAAGLMFDYIGPEMPFYPRIVFANRWLFGPLIERQMAAKPSSNAVLRTTTAATMIDGGVKDNVLPAEARAVVNFRIKPGDDLDAVLRHVQDTVAGTGVKVALLGSSEHHDPPRPSSVDTAGFRLIEQSIRRVRPGTVVTPSLTVSASDSHHYQDLCDAIYRFRPYVLGPDDTARIHGVDERIAVETYGDCIRFHLELIHDAASTTR